MWLFLYYVPAGLILLFVSFNIAWRIWKRKYSFLPSAPNVPWLGTAPYLGFTSHTFYKALTLYASKYNHLYVLWLGPVPVIRTGTVEYIEAILRSQEHLTKSVLYDSLHDWLGFGLLTSTGKKWKKRRTQLTPAFHFSILNDFVDIFVKHACEMVDKLHKVADTGVEVDIQHLCSLSTLDVMCETSMGVKINALKASDSGYVQAVAIVKKLILHRLLNPLLKSNLIYKLTSDGKEFYRNVGILHNFTFEVINRNIDIRKKKSTTNEQPQERKRVFLDLLLDLYDKGEIDIKGIQEEVDTFMFEGHDTTSAAISWTLYEIGRHPDVQSKLQYEIDQIISDDRHISQKIKDLKYLDIVVKECLRFRPPVPMYGRKIESDLIVGTNTIPKGTECIAETFSVHMNEKYWDNPKSFIPERFESEKYLKRNPYSYIPFSAGPRNCIGQRFALLELKIFLVFILLKFNIKSLQFPEDLMTCYDLITYSMNGINLVFKSR